MNEIYIVDGKKYEVASNRKQEFLTKFPSATLFEEPGKITPVGLDAPAEATKASDTVSSSANGFLEPQENLFENKAAQFVADKIGSLGAGTFGLLEGVGIF